MSGRDDTLARAIVACCLWALILEYFPEAGEHRDCYLKPNRARLMAPWRAERSPSVYLDLKGDRWLYCDRGDGNRGGDAYAFLVNVVGLSRGDAARELIARAGLAGEARPHAHRRRPEPAPVALPDFPEELAETLGVMKRYGLGPLWRHDNPSDTALGALALDCLAGWLAECIRADLRAAAPGRVRV